MKHLDSFTVNNDVFSMSPWWFTKTVPKKEAVFFSHPRTIGDC